MRDLYNTINKPPHITKKEERKGVNLLKTIRLNGLDNKLTERSQKWLEPHQPTIHTQRETETETKGSINIEREGEGERVYTTRL